LRFRRQSSLNVSKAIGERSLLAGNLRQPIERFRISRGNSKHPLIMLCSLRETAFAMQPGCICMP